MALSTQSTYKLNCFRAAIHSITFLISSTAKNFYDVLFNLQKGKYSTTPIKSNFGYHIIYLEDLRNVILPAYEKMKPNLYNRMTTREINIFVGTLKDKAKIEIVTSQKSKQ